jgi:uncharacterized protein YndB with AHSA1/START domain
MGDYAIRMQFDVDAEPEAVRAALTTTEGIASWWSDSVEGEPQHSGGELRVRFPDLPEPFAFDVQHGEHEIAWETGAFPPWWQDTTIRWRVTDHPETGGTLLRFDHTGFDPDADIIPVITPAWAAIIGRLKQYAETGKPDPFAVNVSTA